MNFTIIYKKDIIYVQYMNIYKLYHRNNATSTITIPIVHCVKRKKVPGRAFLALFGCSFLDFDVQNTKFVFRYSF